MSNDPQEIDPRNNVESQQAEESASQVGSLAGGGAVFSPARAAGAVPGVPDAADVAGEGGTGAGDPLEGVTIDPADAAQAVPGDQGPEHPGRR